MNLRDVPSELTAKQMADNYYNEVILQKWSDIYEKCLKEINETKYSKTIVFDTLDSNEHYADSIIQKLVQAGYLIKKDFYEAGIYLTITNPFLN